MSIRVIETACSRSTGECLIVVEGATAEEVTTITAKEAALKKARELGLDARGISGSTGAYIVNEHCKELVNMVEVSAEQMTKAALAGKKGATKFRNEFKIKTM